MLTVGFSGSFADVGHDTDHTHNTYSQNSAAFFVGGRSAGHGRLCRCG
jgi:hypothetical protein